MLNYCIGIVAITSSEKKHHYPWVLHVEESKQLQLNCEKNRFHCLHTLQREATPSTIAKKPFFVNFKVSPLLSNTPQETSLLFST